MNAEGCCCFVGVKCRCKCCFGGNVAVIVAVMPMYMSEKNVGGMSERKIIENQYVIVLWGVDYRQ